MTQKRKRLIIILIIIWGIFTITDYTRARIDKAPIFAYPIIIYKDGGSKEYFGLGYKVIKYVNFSAEYGPELLGIEFGSWFMPFSKPQSKLINM